MLESSSRVLDQRVGAACAAMAIALSLLSRPPSRAVPEAAGGSPSHEIGDGGSALVGAGPSTTTRSVDSTLVSFRVAVAQKVLRPKLAMALLTEEQREAIRLQKEADRKKGLID